LNFVSTSSRLQSTLCKITDSSRLASISSSLNLCKETEKIWTIPRLGHQGSCTQTTCRFGRQPIGSSPAFTFLDVVSFSFLNIFQIA
jgi:hypothetical protein